jgi:hypothetical protein
MKKASLYEGHGFSRVSMNLRLTQGDENHGEAVFDCAVNRLCLTASAAEVRFCETHRFAVSIEVLRHPPKALMDPRAVWHG